MGKLADKEGGDQDFKIFVDVIFEWFQLQAFTKLAEYRDWGLVGDVPQFQERTKLIISLLFNTSS